MSREKNWSELLDDIVESIGVEDTLDNIIMALDTDVLEDTLKYIADMYDIEY